MSMFEMPAIGDRLRTQDNRCTADPIFLVQEQKRVYGIDTDFDPKIAWLYDDDCVEVSDPKERARLDEAYLATNDEPSGYRRVGYHEYWEYVQPFFTEAAADVYIKQNSHRHRGSLRTYADSAYRNYEFIAVRAHLMAMPNPAHALTAQSGALELHGKSPLEVVGRVGRGEHGYAIVIPEVAE